jgi:hypothetical protein
MIARRDLLRSAFAAAAALALPLPAAVAQVKAPEELAKLHVLMCADTNSSLRQHMKHNIVFTREAFIGQIPANRLNFVTIEGDQMSPENILKGIADLPVKPNEGVVVFYFGHAGYDKKSDQHVFTLTKEGVDGFKPLLRKDVLAALAAKKAGLAVLLTDCCSSIDRILAGGITPAGVAPPRELNPVMRCLFFQHRGLVDITAAEKGTFAWFGGRTGGVFTQALCQRLLRKPLAALDTDKDGFVSWAELAEELKEETNKCFLELKAEGNNRDVMQQESQIALVFSVPEPGGKPTELKVRPVRGYRLGARVQAVPRGIKVLAVVDGSPAAKLGLEAEDVILSVNGVAPRTLEEYRKLLDGAPMGKARLEVLDARTMKTLVKDVHLDPIR